MRGVTEKQHLKETLVLRIVRHKKEPWAIHAPGLLRVAAQLRRLLLIRAATVGGWGAARVGAYQFQVLPAQLNRATYRSDEP